MKGLLKFIAVAVAILALSVVLAPILFDYLPFKFERIFNRLIMIFTLAAVIFFVRVRRETLSRYGLARSREGIRPYLRTFLMGFFILAVLAGVRLLLQSAQWSPMTFGPLTWVAKVLGALGAAAVIALIEEFFFRGFIFGMLIERFSVKPLPAVVLTSLFYSLIHFVDRVNPYIGPDPVWTDSVTLIKAPFLSLLGWREFWPAAVGLFLFGVILNDLRIRTGALYASMGLHAGCVFFIKMDGHFIGFSNIRPLLDGGTEIYNGLLGWFFLLALWFLLRKMIKSK